MCIYTHSNSILVQRGESNRLALAMLFLSCYEHKILDDYDGEMKMKGMCFLQPLRPLLSLNPILPDQSTDSLTPRRRLLEEALSHLPATDTFQTTDVKRRKTVLKQVSDRTHDQPNPSTPQVSEDAVRKVAQAQSLKQETSRQGLGYTETQKKQEKTVCTNELKGCRLVTQVSFENKLDKRIKLLKKKAQLKC